MDSFARDVNKLLFRFGQILLVVGIVCFIVSTTTTYWVVRPPASSNGNFNPNETIVTERYGIFWACKQKPPPGVNNSKNPKMCGALWDYLNLISGNTVRYIQFLMVSSAVLYAIGLMVEIVQFLPITKYRNFLAQNRVTEAFIAVAAVLILQGIVVFAGEVKNKAERMPGQDDEQPGWSFILCLVGLIITVFALVLTTMFRDLPVHNMHSKGGSWVRNM